MVWGELKTNINKICTLINHYINNVIPKYVNNVLTKDGDMTTGQLIIIIIVGGVIGYLIGKAIIKCDILILMSFLIIFSFIIYLLFKNFEILIQKQQISIREKLFIYFYIFICFLTAFILFIILTYAIKIVIKSIIIKYFKNIIAECGGSESKESKELEKTFLLKKNTVKNDSDDDLGDISNLNFQKIAEEGEKMKITIKNVCNKQTMQFEDGDFSPIPKDDYIKQSGEFKNAFKKTNISNSKQTINIIKQEYSPGTSPGDKMLKNNNILKKSNNWDLIKSGKDFKEEMITTAGVFKSAIKKDFKDAFIDSSNSGIFNSMGGTSMGLGN